MPAPAGTNFTDITYITLHAFPSRKIRPPIVAAMLDKTTVPSKYSQDLPSALNLTEGCLADAVF